MHATIGRIIALFTTLAFLAACGSQTNTNAPQMRLNGPVLKTESAIIIKAGGSVCFTKGMEINVHATNNATAATSEISSTNSIVPGSLLLNTAALTSTAQVELNLKNGNLSGPAAWATCDIGNSANDSANGQQTQPTANASTNSGAPAATPAPTNATGYDASRDPDDDGIDNVTGAHRPTNSPSAPTAAAAPTANAQPTAAAAPTSAPAPSGPISFDPNNPGNNPVANDPGFPGGWGQEDRAPFDNGKEFGHTALIAFGQLYNPSMGAITTDSNIQILTFPGKSLKLSVEWEGSRWHNSNLHFARYDEMADEQVSRAKANGGDIPRPFTFLIDGNGQIFVKTTTGGIWEQTDKLPAGIEVIDATDSTAPVVDTSASCTGVDVAFEMSKIYPDTLKGDLPLGDAQLFAYGYVLNKADPSKSTYFLVSPGVVLWIPAGNVVAKMHVCEAPNAMPASTIIIDSTNAQLPADWTSNGFHVTPFSAQP